MPWLLPDHAPPWSTFYNEAAMAMAMLPIGLWVVWASSRPVRIGPLAAGFAALSVTPLLQAAAGLFVFPGEALVVSLYILAFASTIMVARHAQDVAPLRLADALFASFVVAALLSTAVALCQWAMVDLYVPFTAPPMPGGRPVANVGQANNLSSLLVWGVVGLWWFHSREKLNSKVALLTAAFLLMGIALTQSRTGVLAVGAMAAIALAARRRFSRPPTWGAVIALALWFALIVVLDEPLGRHLMRTDALTLANQLEAGKRPDIWRMALSAIAEHPWFGYGWNQSVQAHVALADKYPQLHTTVQHAHNIVLDLMLWTGIPLGLVVCAGLAWWLWLQVIDAESSAQILILVAIATFGLHALLELPHTYLMFLLPTAALMGTLSAMGPQRGWPSFRCPRLVFSGLVMAQALVFAIVVSDYSVIQESILARRMRAAHIRSTGLADASSVHVLSGLADALERLATPPRAAMSSAELARFRRTLDRYPSYAALLNYARSAELDGRHDDAAWSMELLCHLHPVADCEAAKLVLRAKTESKP